MALKDIEAKLVDLNKSIADANINLIGYVQTRAKSLADNLNSILDLVWVESEEDQKAVAFYLKKIDTALVDLIYGQADRVNYYIRKITKKLDGVIEPIMAEIDNYRLMAEINIKSFISGVVDGIDESIGSLHEKILTAIWNNTVSVSQLLLEGVEYMRERLNDLELNIPKAVWEYFGTWLMEEVE